MSLVQRIVRAYESVKPQQQELPLAIGEAIEVGDRAREERPQGLQAGKPQ
jgi:hypothetical protein